MTEFSPFSFSVNSLFFSLSFISSVVSVSWRASFGGSAVSVEQRLLFMTNYQHYQYLPSSSFKVWGCCPFSAVSIPISYRYSTTGYSVWFLYLIPYSIPLLLYWSGLFLLQWLQVTKSEHFISSPLLLLHLWEAVLASLPILDIQRLCVMEYILLHL